MGQIKLTKRIVRGITLGIEYDKIGWLKDLYAYDGSEDFIRNFLEWQDDRLITALLDKKANDGYAKQIFERLTNRDLLKCVFSCQPADFRNPEVRKRVFEGNREFLQAMEREIAKSYSLDQNLVIAQFVRLKSVSAQSATTEGQIIVLRPDGPRLFHEESTLFRSIDAAAQEQYLEVYAPVRYGSDREKKRRRREFHADIVAIAETVASSLSGDCQREGE